MSFEFQVIPDDDMNFDVILGTKILNSVDMIVTKYGTIFSPRVQSVQKRPTTGSDDNQAGQSFCMQLISQFESLCMISTKDSKMKDSEMKILLTMNCLFFNIRDD